ncbi:hypothetical protein BGZ98_009291, partial [Dissophora globulifera]
MNCGTLSTRLRSSFLYKPELNDNQRQQLARTMTNLIKEMVRIATDTTRHAQQAIAVHIANTMLAFPGMDNASIARRKTEFAQYNRFHSNTFFRNVMFDIFTFHDTGPRLGQGWDNNAPANVIVANIILGYRLFLNNAQLEVSVLNENIKTGLSHLFALAGDRLGNQVQTHYRRHISELVSRLHRYNPVWCQGVEGANVLSTIINGSSTLHDQVSLFWILNTRLPQHAQIAFVPESPFKNSFFNVTELMLVHVIFASDERVALEPINTLVGATITEAMIFVAEQPGELIHYLFFDRKLDYYRRTTVVATSP